ncbi:MAG: P1 family peptidase [Chloroflexi bacterium]|nr:P1 family peptidase [Chloroflexota bacterium]
MTVTNDTLTAVPGIRVGHHTDLDAATGCTVIICPPGTVGGVDQRGGAPGTRETDLLRPMHQVDQVSAIVLAGGSAYGLAAADGVMRCLEADGIGYKTGLGYLVPIVASAILFDLAVGSATVRPDAAMGAAACRAATPDPVTQGTVGAGTGARVGAMLGNATATKGGLGSASIDLGDGLMVAALVAVNAVGDVIDADGTILAGLRQSPESSAFVGMLNALRTLPRPASPAAASTESSGENTVIGVVATNAALNKEQTNKVAQMAHDGLARAVRPAHTMFDGDTLFALATGTHPANVNLIGAYAAEIVAQAIRNGVRAATSIADVRALRDLNN